MKRFRKLIKLCAFFVFCGVMFLSCVKKEKPAPQMSSAGEVKTGGIKMIAVDGKYKVWTKKVGDGKIKVLTLHGGPAGTHEYFECFEDFLPQAGIEFYYYDQLGSYYSDQPSDTSLWHLPRFVEEVEQVRKGLGLDQFYLLGHSWGGILAAEYALKYQQHLKGLIISNMVADFDRYDKYNQKLRAQLPAELLKFFEKFESIKDFHNPEYEKAVVANYYTKHLCRLAEWPDPVNRSFKHLNLLVYEQMQGPSEFVPGGNLVGWSVWDRLKNITVPTLTIGGAYDTMNPEDMKEMANLLPNARYHFCPNGSHMSMWDDQENYFNGLIQFLKDVDGGKFSKTKARF